MENWELHTIRCGHCGKLIYNAKNLAEPFRIKGPALHIEDGDDYCSSECSKAEEDITFAEYNEMAEEGEFDDCNTMLWDASDDDPYNMQEDYIINHAPLTKLNDEQLDWCIDMNKFWKGHAITPAERDSHRKRMYKAMAEKRSRNR